jgi:hypothetical protein
MSKRDDDNLVSFTGDERGNVWRNGVHIFGPDVPEHDVPTHQRVVVERDLVDLLEQALDEGRVIADVLKFSGVLDMVVVVEGICPGGREDCVDVNNRSDNLVIHAPAGFRPAGKYVSTIKGGSADISIHGPILEGARVVEHDLGNWSDQSQARTGPVSLSTPSAGGWPVRWRRLNAMTPALGEGRYTQVLGVRGWFRPIFVKLYALGKRLGLPI